MGRWGDAQDRIILASTIPAQDAARTKREQIIDGFSIRDRPADVEDRAIPDHWEGDLITGAPNAHMATLVERQSRFILLGKVQGKDTIIVEMVLSKQIQQLPSALRRSLTQVRRMELVFHARLAHNRVTPNTTSMEDIGV